MFAYPCPFCQQRLLASPERVGQRTICPKCLKPIMIPRPDSPSGDEGRVVVPNLIGDSPSTIFAEDYHEEEYGEDGMDLSLPDDQEEFVGFVNDSGQLLPSLDTPQPSQEESVPNFPVEHAYAAPAMALAAGAPPAAPPHLGGLGAGPAAYAPMKETLLPSATTPTPMPRDNGVVVFHASSDSSDIAAELTTVLTMRMKPPPEPPSDLRISTGAWLALTAVGLSLWMLSMMRIDDGPARELLQAVSIIGILEIVISYVWVAYLSGRKTTQRGLEALLPPVWIHRLFHPCENTPGYRPLRFAAAGLLLVLLAVLGGFLRPAVQHITGEPDTRPVEIPKPINSPLNRVKESQHEGINRQITDALSEIATDKAAFTATAEEAPQLLEELQRLRTHENGEVRGAALVALKKWAGLDAVKPDVLKVLRNKNAEVHERKSALEVAREYKDREVARAVAACMSYRGFLDDTDRRAADALRAMGPPEAEDALLELFEDEDLLLRGLPGLLAEIGGPKSVTQLRKLATTAQSREVRDEATKIADKIANRIGLENKHD